MKDLVSQDFSDRTAATEKKARIELLESAARDWAEAKEMVSQAAELELGALRKMREAGLKLQEASGRETPKFSFYQECALPVLRQKKREDLSFEAVKFCVGLIKVFSEGIESLSEARGARQRLFEVVGAAPVPKREKAQRAHENNDLSKFVSSAASLRSSLNKLGELQGLEQGKLETLVREVGPVVEVYARAVELRPQTMPSAATRDGLTKEERTELEDCLQVIERGQKVFLEVANALLRVQEKRLYRETHPNFESWCQEHCGCSRERAYQMIAGARTVQNLQSVNHGSQFVLPASESLVRPLRGLLPDVQRRVWAEAVETAPKAGLTREHVEKVVRGMTRK
jgi:hypothetical protein